MAVLIGRRVVRLEDPPGATVTIGPWSVADFQLLGALKAADDLAGCIDLFVAHIEAHPFVVDVRELDAVALAPIVRAWTASHAALPATRGPRN